MTATRNTFHDRDVVIGVADSFQQGAPVERVLELARQVAGEREVVAIPDEREPRYTTRELLAAEETIVAQAQEGRGQHAGVLEPEHVERSLEGLERKLSDEQEQAVSAIATAGHRIDTVEALAGTGKTTSAAALRELYERAGYRVIGAAPTGRAVRELKERAGIGESRTLDSWALKLAADPTALSFATLDRRGRAAPAGGDDHRRGGDGAHPPVRPRDPRCARRGGEGDRDRRLRAAVLRAGGRVARRAVAQARLARAARGDAPARPARTATPGCACTAASPTPTSS